MAEPQLPPPATLFVALLHAPVNPDPCIEELTARFGPAGPMSSPYPMNRFSTYYEAEMGPDLTKRFIAFARPLAMDQLADCKLAATAVEKRLQRRPGRRVFNVDPGLVTSYNVVLATFKNHAHRIYLRDGVFAEITLIFREGKFHPLPWTYPDYQAPQALDFFHQLRTAGKDRGHAPGMSP